VIDVGVDVQVFALLEVSVSGVYRLDVFILIFEAAVGLIKFPKPCFALVSNEQTLIIKLFLFFIRFLKVEVLL
jgi:hypothetical protein